MDSKLPSWLWMLLSLIIPGTFFIAACGDGDTYGGSDPGDLSFKIAYARAENGSQRKTAAINCDETGIVTIDIQLSDSNGVFLAGRDGLDCKAGRGTLTGVPAGSGLSLLIMGKDADGNLILRGMRSGIQVHANQNTDVGTIECQSFVPNPMSPAEDTLVNPNAMGLAWYPVPGAVKYRIVVSESRELTDPIIQEWTHVANFTPAASDLVDGQDYFWQAVAYDNLDRPGGGSPILGFTVSAGHENTPPLVRLISPAGGSAYTSNDLILFSGSSSDAEDGELMNASLVWHSNVDGFIGTGQSFSLNTISAGAHEIVLTAIDADGASSAAIVEIMVNASDSNTSPAVRITNPVQGTTFSNGEAITFEGGASDLQDGDLSGASLVWRSDLDGVIGHDQIFTIDSLGSGTHRITLTATDSEGASAVDETMITIGVPKPIKVLFAIDCSNSMGAGGEGSDPDNLRISAALAFIDHYNPSPHISFEIMLWNHEITQATMTQGFRGFTKDIAELQRVLNAAANDGSTDYLATIEGIRTDIQRDILDIEPDIRAQTKYIVLFLTDGLDNPPGGTGPRVDEVVNAIGELHSMAVDTHKVGMLSFHTFFLSGITMPLEARQACIDLLQNMSSRGGGELLREYDRADDINYINSVDMAW